jgi:hypothetical protein
LHALIDTPFRPHIFLTLAFTVVRLAVPDIRALKHLAMSTRHVEAPNQRPMRWWPKGVEFVWGSSAIIAR